MFLDFSDKMLLDSGTIIRCLFNKSMNLLLICRSFIKVLLFISLIIPPILDPRPGQHSKNPT